MHELTEKEKQYFVLFVSLSRFVLLLPVFCFLDYLSKSLGKKEGGEEEKSEITEFLLVILSSESKGGVLAEFDPSLASLLLPPVRRIILVCNEESCEKETASCKQRRSETTIVDMFCGGRR